MLENLKSRKKVSELADNYPHNDNYISKYINYQHRYNSSPRESDKRIMELLTQRFNQDSKISMLDIGCSTGALLKHLRDLFPQSTLIGGDFSAQQINFCKAEPDLQGINFYIMDVLNLKAEHSNTYDVVIANALLWIFEQKRFEEALKEIYSSLKPGGYLIAYDFFHKYLQEISIVEHSTLFPEGLPLHYRSISNVTEVLNNIGYLPPTFEPFQIGIDLAESPELDSIGTRTVLSENKRLCFRGILYQPWCFLMVQKPY